MSKKSVLLEGADLKAVISYYEKERNDLFVKLQYIDQVLSTLGTGGSRKLSPPSKNPRLKQSKAEVDTKRGRPKKRGPKSVWGNFIMRRLRQCDRPLGYNELIRDAMVMNNLPEARRKEARASILNATFRLRTVAGKIDSKGIEGRKERFLVLTSWLDNKGELLPDYNDKFIRIAQLSEEFRGPIARRGTSPIEDMKKIHSRMNLSREDIVQGEADRLNEEAAEAAKLKELTLAKGRKKSKVAKADKKRSAERLDDQPKRPVGRPRKASFKADLAEAKAKAAAPKSKAAAPKARAAASKAKAAAPKAKAAAPKAKAAAPKAKAVAPAPKPKPSKRKRIHKPTEKKK